MRRRTGPRSISRSTPSVCAGGDFGSRRRLPSTPRQDTDPARGRGRRVGRDRDGDARPQGSQSGPHRKHGGQGAARHAPPAPAAQAGGSEGLTRHHRSHRSSNQGDRHAHRQGYHAVQSRHRDAGRHRHGTSPDCSRTSRSAGCPCWTGPANSWGWFRPRTWSDSPPRSRTSSLAAVTFAGRADRTIEPDEDAEDDAEDGDPYGFFLPEDAPFAEQAMLAELPKAAWRRPRSRTS
jgi:hypothetical protein